MQIKPTGWPSEGDNETTPEVFLEMADAAWPPARDGAPQGTAVVGEWSVTRQLTGSSLPGQIRGATGFSIATGSVDFAQPDGAPLSPWGRGSLAVGPGGACALYASHFGPSTLTGLRLGAFVVAPISGSNASGLVHLELEENSIRLKKPLVLDWFYNTQVSYYAEPPYELDACWVLDQVARSGGYFQTPPAVRSAFLSLPLVGGTMADRGETRSAVISGWTGQDNSPALGPASKVEATINRQAFPDSFYIYAEVAENGGRIRIGTAVFDFSSTKLSVRDNIVTLATATYPTTASRPIVRVQAQVTRETSLRFLVRSRADGRAWSPTVTVTFPSSPWDGATDTASVETAITPTNRWIRGVQLHTVDDDAVWADPSADIDITNSPLHAAFGTEGSTAWDVAQQVASATMGAVWVSETGVFTYRNADRMRGIGDPVETIEALDAVESLEWMVDPAEIADRVELTYIPTSVVASNGATTLWEATQVIRVRANTTITLYADIEGATNNLAPFVPLWKTQDGASVNYTETQMSRWAASMSPVGGGEQPADGALTVSAEMVGMSKARIRIRNNTAANLWLVDASGSPALILRASIHISPGEQTLVEHGPNEKMAVSPLTIDAGAWVQDPGTAQRMLDWMVEQTSSAKAVLNQVRVKPDLKRQLGDVVRLTDGHTGLRAKAIITGVNLNGGPGEYTQHLNLALLDVVFQDFDRWTEEQGLTTFADLDEWLAANNITTFAQLDEWAIDLGGTW